AVACSNPVMSGASAQTNISASGSLEINLTSSGSDRSAVPAEYTDAVSQFEILITGTQSMGPMFVTDSVIFLEDLPIGEYTVSAIAIDAEGKTLAAGSTLDVLVTGEEGDSVIILLLPVMGGEGTIVLEYDWSKAGFPSGTVNGIIASFTPTGGNSVPVNVEISENGLHFTGDFPSGEYVFTCGLFNEEVLISSITETVRIFDGLETETSINFGPEVFYTVPSPPEIPEIRQKGLAVELSWVDSSELESGYEIYRSTGDGNYALIGNNLPANTVVWTDDSVKPGASYHYKIVAVNTFGESLPQEISLTVNHLIITPPASDIPALNVVIGDKENLISIDSLLEGYHNNLNRFKLEILSVSVNGGASVRIDGDNVIVDASSVPYDSEGKKLILEYKIHIPGMPINSNYAVSGFFPLELSVPEMEAVARENLLEPVKGYVFDNRAALEQKMELYEPHDPQEIFDNWGRISNHAFYKNGEDAEASREKRGDEADMALLWKLKKGGEGTYIEYARNSVYAGLISPEGEESDNYILEATVTSKDDDDDTIGLIVAFFRDGNTNYILEAARSHGSLSDGDYIEPRKGWGLVVRRLSPGAVKPEIGDVLWSRQLDVGGVNSRGWKHSRTRIRVVRDGDRISVSTTDWDDEGNYVLDSLIEVDLRSERQLARFSGPRSYGYFTASQERTSFRNISMNGGVIQDKLFYLDRESGESEVWWFDRNSHRWIRMSGVDIQGVIGYPVEITNPETGLTYLIEHRGYRRGRWKEQPSG
ncbi:MAG: fibronectin type III domain-containing protein, partial [Spirochaetaceae bacterium]|nr:fibronectin type III domain-containing protein [Spirochaetaceae bacterium]